MILLGGGVLAVVSGLLGLHGVAAIGAGIMVIGLLLLAGKL